MEEEEIIIKSVDLRGKSLKTITPDDIPPKAEDVCLSNNDIAKLPDDFFFTKCRIWNIYLDYNLLTSLKFVTCFQYLGTLDVSNNLLELDDILDLRKIHILYLYIQDNNFQKYTSCYPLTIPALLKRAWIIDGVFMTDYIRNKAKEFKKTKQFGEVILAARRDPLPFYQQESTSIAAKSFLGGTTCRFVDPSRFLNPNGMNVEFLTKKPQMDRLTYLTNQIKDEIPEGEFFDLFSVVLGILSLHWLNFPLHIIPRFLSRPYWPLFLGTFTKFENWNEYVILNKLDKKINPKSDKEIYIWNRVNMRKYLHSGWIPQVGTFPRLFICSIVYRSEDLNEEILKNEDMQIYIKFRNSFDFGPADRDFDSILNEFTMNLPYEETVIPHKSDLVSIRHPFNNEWTTCEVIELINGRAILKVDNSFYQPIALSSLFWDGRGFFREKQKIEDADQKPQPKKPIKEEELLFNYNKATTTKNKTDNDDDINDFLFENTNNSNIDNNKRPLSTSNRRTFITVADSIEDSESTKQDADKFSIPLPPCAIPSQSILPRDDPTVFLRTSQTAMSTRVYKDSCLRKQRMSNTSLDRTRNVNVNVNEPKLASMKLKQNKDDRKAVSQYNSPHPQKKFKGKYSSSFRGIVDPVSKRPKKIFARTATTRRKPSQVVDCVVNITLGAEVANSRRIRIFHVRVVNTITNKYSYVKVKEDEISEDDAMRLIELYKQHIESKMIIVPGE